MSPCAMSLLQSLCVCSARSTWRKSVRARWPPRCFVLGAFSRSFFSRSRFPLRRCVSLRLFRLLGCPPPRVGCVCGCVCPWKTRERRCIRALHVAVLRTQLRGGRERNASPVATAPHAAEKEDTFAGRGANKMKMNEGSSTAAVQSRWSEPPEEHLAAWRGARQ